jgi:hypothetical protein
MNTSKEKKEDVKRNPKKKKMKEVNPNERNMLSPTNQSELGKPNLGLPTSIEVM